MSGFILRKLEKETPNDKTVFMRKLPAGGGKLNVICDVNALSACVKKQAETTTIQHHGRSCAYRISQQNV